MIILLPASRWHQSILTGVDKIRMKDFKALIDLSNCRICEFTFIVISFPVLMPYKHIEQIGS